MVVAVTGAKFEQWIIVRVSDPQISGANIRNGGIEQQKGSPAGAADTILNSRAIIG